MCLELHKLNLISLSESIFTGILFKQIELKVQRTCAGKFDEKTIDTLIEWLENFVYKWLESIVCPSGF